MRHRPLPRLALAAAVAVTTAASQPVRLDAQPPARQVTQSVTATATFRARSSLRVSSSILHFEVTEAAPDATASLEFSAGARTAPGDDVRLVIDALQHVAGVLAVVEGPDGTIAGLVSSDGPTVAARWMGGGLRSGRLAFRLHGAAPGRYDIPITLALTIG